MQLSDAEGIQFLSTLVEDGVHSTLATYSSAPNYIQVTFHQLKLQTQLNRFYIRERYLKVEGFSLCLGKQPWKQTCILY